MSSIATARGRAVRRHWVRSFGAVIGVFAALAVVGCGSTQSTSTTSSSQSAATSSSSSGSGAGGSATGAVAAAKTTFEKYTKPQPAITVPPLPRRPAAGKTLVVTTCPLPVCHNSTDPAVVAGKALGWKVTQIEQALTGPQAVAAAWQQILQSPPQLMAYAENEPDAVARKFISAAAQKGVKIVEMAPEQTTPPGPTPPVYGQVEGAPELAESGRLMGDAVVGDAGLGAKTVWIYDPTLPFFGPAQQAFTQVVTGARGSVGTLQISLANIGKGVPSQVVGYVQTHPDLKYLAFALNDMTAGVPQALKAAGLANQVKIVSRAPAAANIHDIQTGAQWVTVLEEVPASGWRAVDMLARLSEGQSIPRSLSNPDGWHMIIDKANAGSSGAVPQTPGVPQMFYKAWHLSSAG